MAVSENCLLSTHAMSPNFARWISAVDAELMSLQCTAGSIARRFKNAIDTLPNKEQQEYASKMHDVIVKIFEAAFDLARDVRKAKANPPLGIVLDSESEED